MFNYNATIVKIVDGDTFYLTVDLGFFVSIFVKTRLIGIDAPEVSTLEGRKVRDLLRSEMPIGSSVVIHTEKDPGDKFGRWLAKIEGPMGDVADWLITQNMAKPYFGGAKLPI